MWGVGPRWRTVAAGSGGAVAALLALAAVALRDPEAGALTLVALVALGLLRWRTGLLGVVGLALLSANVAFWMAPGAVSNLSHGEGLWETALPSVMTVAAVTTVIATVADLAGRRRPTTGRTTAPKTVAVVAVAAAIAALGGSALMAADGGLQQRPGDLALVTADVKFAPDAIEATTGTVGVFVANEDLFWHTFTITELDVNLNVPVGGERRITFDAPAGSYRFTCAIPGHTQAGMEGTLVVG